MAAALADASRRVQADIRRKLLADAAKAWPLLNPQRLNESWPGWLRVMTALLRSYHGQTAAAASAYYRAERLRTVGEAPLSVVKLADPPSDEWLTRALGYAAPYRIDRFVEQGFREDQAVAKVLPMVLGTAERVVLDGQRTTILDSVEQDTGADARWYRLTDADPCGFCALLASRGAVFRSEDTASFETHNSCGCTAAVSFTGQVTLTGAAARASDVYFGMKQSPNYDSDKTLLQNFRAAWTAAQVEPATAADAAA